MPKKLCALLASFVAVLACQRGEQMIPERQRAFRERALQQMKQSMAFERRLRDLQGATSAEVLRAIDKPARSSPCAVNAPNCFYYDVAGRTQFICFDEHDRAVCHGSVNIAPPPRTTAGRYR